MLPASGGLHQFDGEGVLVGLVPEAPAGVLTEVLAASTVRCSPLHLSSHSIVGLELRDTNVDFIGQTTRGCFD
jgi:hypothetical protein